MQLNIPNEKLDIYWCKPPHFTPRLFFGMPLELLDEARQELRELGLDYNKSDFTIGNSPLGLFLRYVGQKEECTSPVECLDYFLKIFQENGEAVTASDLFHSFSSETNCNLLEWVFQSNMQNLVFSADLWKDNSAEASALYSRAPDELKPKFPQGFRAIYGRESATSEITMSGNF